MILISFKQSESTFNGSLIRRILVLYVTLTSGQLWSSGLSSLLVEAYCQSHLLFSINQHQICPYNHFTKVLTDRFLVWHIMVDLLGIWCISLFTTWCLFFCCQSICRTTHYYAVFHICLYGNIPHALFLSISISVPGLFWRRLGWWCHQSALLFCLPRWFTNFFQGHGTWYSLVQALMLSIMPWVKHLLT